MLKKFPKALFSVLMMGLLSLSCTSRSSEPTVASVPKPTPSLAPLPQAPILRLETAMHTQRISQIDVDEQNQYLVTASNDKTVRVWDLPSGQLLKILRPPIGPDREGKIFAVAISPDGATIACAGWTGQSWDGVFSIYLFNRVSGELVHRISGLRSSVASLTYSKDGRVLAATLHGSYGKNGVRLYRAKDYELIAEHAKYGAESYGADFDKSGRLVTSSFEGVLRLYDQEFQLLAQKKVAGGIRPVQVSFSPDGGKIAVGFADSHQVSVVSGKDLSLLYSPSTADISEGTFNSVAWSDNGQSLFGAGSVRLEGTHPIRKWSEEGRGPSQDFLTVNNTILSLATLKNGGVAFGAAGASFGWIDDQNLPMFVNQAALADFRDNHEGLLLSPDGSVVQFAYAQFGKDPAQFSIDTRVLSVPPPSTTSLVSPRQKSEKIRLGPWLNSLEPTINEKPLVWDQYEVARSVAISPDEDVVLFGTPWHLRLYDAAGQQIWQTAISDNAWGVNISQDGQVAVASLGDGTIRWYRLKDGKELFALYPHSDHERWIVWTPSGFYDAAPGSEELIGWHKNYGRDYASDFFPVGRFRSISYRPDIIGSVLATWDEQAAIRLANGAQGSKVVLEERLPNSILQEVTTRQEALEEAVAEAGGKSSTTGGEATSRLFKNFPPEVVILSPSTTIVTSQPFVTLHYTVITHPESPMTDLVVMIDGEPLTGTRGIQVVGNIVPGQTRQKIEIPIPSRSCTISLVAKHRWATGQAAKIEVEWDEQLAKPNLYVLAIGIGDYPDAALHIPTAAADAELFASSVQQQADRLYDQVQVKTFVDSSATKENILDGLDWLHGQTTQKDVAMIYFTGHSITDRGGFPYFFTPQSQRDRLRQTGLSLSDVTNAVISMAGTSLLFLDSCQANTPIGSIGCIQGINSVSQELGNASNPVVAFLASSGTQRSISNPTWVHSSFTTALAEALTGQSDELDAEMMTVNRLGLYVSNRVKALTQGYQKPTTIKPQTIRDFPIALLTEAKVSSSTLDAISPPTIAAIQPAQEILSRLPPVMTILSPSNHELLTSTNVSISYTVRNPSGEPVTNVMALIDGRRVPQTRGIQVVKGKQLDAGIQEYTLTVPPRDVSVSLIAKNRWATSEPATVRLQWKGSKSQPVRKAKLNVLAVGISAYADPTLTLSFAAKDAQDFTDVLNVQAGGLYEEVNVTTLTDQEATKENILDGLADLDAATSSSDVAMIFLAGHGVNDSGGIYYFLPVNADTTRLRRTGLPYSDIKNTVATLSGKTLLFVDSCHAGDVMGMRRGAADINAFVNELTSAENGAVVFASSTGRQFALEDPRWGNGAFTKALIEGIQGGADYRQAGAITVNSLDLYLSDRVKALTNGQQTPTTTKPHTIQDFPIAIIRPSRKS